MVTLSLRPSITMKLLKLPGTLEEKLLLTDVEAKSGAACVWGSGLLCCFRNGILAFKTSLFFLHALSPNLHHNLTAQALVYWQRGAACLLVVMAIAMTTAGFSSKASIALFQLQVKHFIKL